MALNDDISGLSAAAITAQLCQRLEQIRLSKNVSQAALATAAGVSRSTLTRMADGRNLSLDSFVRIARALGLTEQLVNLLPDPAIRPVELAAHSGQHRQRASGSRKQNAPAPWQWGDEDDTP